MALATDQFNLIIKYFNASEDRNKTKKSIERFIKKYDDKHFIQYLKDVYETPIDEKGIIDLLLALNVPLDQWVLYLSSPMSLHGLLNELSQNAVGTSPQLPWLLDLIENKTLYKELKDLLKLLLPILFILTLPFFFIGLETLLLLDFLIETANIMPLAGIGSALTILGVSLYFNKADLRTPKHRIMVDYYFLLASNAFNIAGKLFLILSKAAFITVAQYLFVVSALVNVLKQIYHLQEFYREKKELGDCEPSSSVLIYQGYARLHFEGVKRRNELIISILSAALVATLVFSCLIFPPGFLLTIAISTSTLLVHLLEMAALKLNAKVITSILHTNLEEIAKWRIDVEEESDKNNPLEQAAETKENITPRTAKFQRMCSVSNLNRQPSTLRVEPSLRRLEIKEEQPYFHSQRSLRDLRQKCRGPEETKDSILTSPDKKKSNDAKLNRFFKYYCPEEDQLPPSQTPLLTPILEEVVQKNLQKVGFQTRSS